MSSNQDDKPDANPDDSGQICSSQLMAGDGDVREKLNQLITKRLRSYEEDLTEEYVQEFVQKKKEIDEKIVTAVSLKMDEIFGRKRKQPRKDH